MIVLDTHAWVWWVSRSNGLSRKARELIDRAAAADGMYVSSISVWEVAQLVAKRRLELSMAVGDWIAKSESLPFLTFVPVDNCIALKSTQLPGYLHQDPADRIIIATALSLGTSIVTKDRKIQSYSAVETLW